MLDEEGSDLSELIRKVFKDRGHDPTEDVPLGNLESKWKGIMKGTDLKGYRDAYWNAEAGWCDAAAATASVMKTALRHGVNYVTGDIAELLLEGDNVKGVRTTKGEEYLADQIVLATGAWTSSLLSPIEDRLSMPEDQRVERQAQAAGVAVAHYKMSVKEMEQLSDVCLSIG